MRNIYADNSATTALSPAVLEKMMPYLTEVYGNPSSIYKIGAKAKEAVEILRVCDRMTREIFTLPILEKFIVFHTFLRYT
jgi:cysteine sulfinate desulfinase/cysteine desulfurase-like protein